LKLENILYNPKKKQARLIDFGLCTINASHCNELCTNWCGSPDYVCPEILLQQPYSGCLSDTWSIGVILYVLLFGQMPFNFKERFHALQHGKSHPSLEFVEDKDLPYRVSDTAKDLIKKMLTSNPKERITIEEIAHHKWCAKRANILQLLGIGKCYHNADTVKPKKEEKEKKEEKPKVDYKTKPLPEVPSKPQPEKPESKPNEKSHRRGLRRKNPEEKLGSDKDQVDALVTVKSAQEITTVV
jgi:serine/threonine protein kinase